MPGIDEDSHAPAAIDCTGLPPSTQTQPDDCRPGGVRHNRASAPGGGAAISGEAGFDVAEGLCYTMTVKRVPGLNPLFTSEIDWLRAITI